MNEKEQTNKTTNKKKTRLPVRERKRERNLSRRLTESIVKHETGTLSIKYPITLNPLYLLLSF
jgi:hypothetical protein